MKIPALLSVLVFAHAMLFAGDNLQWRDARELTIEGKGWSDTKDFYDRLPARAEKVVRPAVWNLSLDSAGMAVRFITDSTNITVRWVLRKQALGMPHMAPSGVSGVDLYVKEKAQWKWAGGGRPKDFPTNQIEVVKGMRVGSHECILYLPLYNGVTSVEVGVPAGSKLEPAPARGNPVVFYGTSILQGACASRPGMAYPAILGRKLDYPTLNLGFSGNALSEPEIASLLAELNPPAFVLDPLPNMTPDLVLKRSENLIQTIRTAHPRTPIILVESLPYTDSDIVPARRDLYANRNAALRPIYERLAKKDKLLYYVSSKDLVGNDTEATVDGTHPNDLGFMRLTEKIEPVLRKVLRSHH